MNLNLKIRGIADLPYICDPRISKKVMERAGLVSLALTVILVFISARFFSRIDFDLGTRIFAVSAGVFVILHLVFAYFYFYKHEQRRQRIAELRAIRFGNPVMKFPPLKIPNKIRAEALKRIQQQEAVEGTIGEPD